MHAAAMRDAGKAVADLHPLDAVEPHHGVRDVGVQPVVDRLAQADRHLLRAHPQARAAGIAALAQRTHVVLDCRHVGHRGEEGVVGHMLPALKADRQLADVRHAAAEGGAVLLAQPFLRHRTGGHRGRRQPRRRAPAAARVAQPVLTPVGVIGVAGAKALRDVAVVLAALILVADQQADRRAGGLALVHAREDLDPIRLIALGDELAGAGPPPIQVGLDVGLRQRHAGRTAVDDAADRRAMGFTKVRDGKQRAEGIAAHGERLSDERRLG